jgi:hypothetical protein
MKRIFGIALAAMTCAWLFTSCENNQWFRSEKELKKLIQGTWKKQFFTIVDFEQNWIFQEGSVYVLQLKAGNKDTIDKGMYSIDAKLFVSYLEMQGFTHDTIGAFNNKFTIVELDEEVMLIAADLNVGGLIQHEFSRKK